MKRKLFLIFLVMIVIAVYKTNEQTIFIPDASIRLRVIPNSNNPRDISIKEEVKDYLENNIYILTKDTSNIEEARMIIKENIPAIQKNIDAVFKEKEYPLPYDINYGNNYFPKKVYKGVTYKEGYYESLVISIGDANGDNWWCVLFPNFCLIDNNNNNHEYKLYIKEIMNNILKK